MTAQWTGHAATGIEVLGAGILVAGISLTLLKALFGLIVPALIRPTYDNVRRDLAHVLLLGLEILVAADIIETISVGIELRSLAFLAGIVAIRIALSWSLEVETTGRWPWQQPTKSTPPPRPQTETTPIT